MVTTIVYTYIGLHRLEPTLSLIIFRAKKLVEKTEYTAYLQLNTLQIVVEWCGAAGRWFWVDVMEQNMFMVPVRHIIKVMWPCVEKTRTVRVFWMRDVTCLWRSPWLGQSRYAKSELIVFFYTWDSFKWCYQSGQKHVDLVEISL